MVQKLHAGRRAWGMASGKMLELGASAEGLVSCSNISVSLVVSQKLDLVEDLPICPVALSLFVFIEIPSHSKYAEELSRADPCMKNLSFHRSGRYIVEV